MMRESGREVYTGVNSYNININTDTYQSIIGIYTNIIEDLESAKKNDKPDRITGELKTYYNSLQGNDVKSTISTIISEFEDIILKIEASIDVYEQIDEGLATELNSIISSIFSISKEELRSNGTTLEERKENLNNVINVFESNLKVLKDDYASLFTFSEEDVSKVLHVFDALGVNIFDYNAIYNEKNESYDIKELGKLVNYLQQNKVNESFNRYFKEENDWINSGMEKLFGDGLKNYYWLYRNSVGYSDEANAKLDSETLFFENFMNGFGANTESKTSGVYEEITNLTSHIYLYGSYCQEKYQGLEYFEDYFYTDDEELIINEGFNLTFAEWLKNWEEEQKKYYYNNQRELESEGYATFEEYLKYAKNYDSETSFDLINACFNLGDTVNGKYTFWYELNNEDAWTKESAEKFIKSYIVNEGSLDILDKTSENYEKGLELQKDIIGLENALYNCEQYYKLIPFEEDKKNATYLSKYITNNYDANYKNEVLPEDWLQYLDRSELALLDYLYNEKGKYQAKEYIDAMEDVVNQRKGFLGASKFIESINTEHRYTEEDYDMATINGDPNSLFMPSILKLFSELFPNTYDQGIDTGISAVTGFIDGNYNFIDGFYDIANADGIRSAKDYELLYKMQLLSGDNEYTANLSEEEKKWLSNVYQFGNSLGYMTIPTLLNWVPVVGETLSFSALTLSSSGNSTEDLMQQGVDKERAYMYGTLMGLSESVVEKLIGGLPGSPDNAGKGLFGFIKSSLGEAGEEAFQTYISAGISSMATGEPIDFVATTNEAYEAGLMAIFTSGAMNMGGKVFLKMADTIIETSPSNFNSYEEWRTSVETEFRKTNPDISNMFMEKPTESSEFVLDIGKEEINNLDNKQKEMISNLTYDTTSGEYQVTLINGNTFNVDNLDRINSNVLINNFNKTSPSTEDFVQKMQDLFTKKDIDTNDYSMSSEPTLIDPSVETTTGNENVVVKPEPDSPFNTFEDTTPQDFKEVTFDGAEQDIQKSPFDMEEEVPTLVNPNVDGNPNNIFNGFANISNAINEGISSIKDATQNVAQGVLNKIDGNGVNSTQNEGPTLIDPSVDTITGNENVVVKPELDSPFNTYEDTHHSGFEEVAFGDAEQGIQKSPFEMEEEVTSTEAVLKEPVTNIIETQEKVEKPPLENTGQFDTEKSPFDFEEVTFGDTEQDTAKSPFDMEEETTNDNLNKPEGPTLVDPNVEITTENESTGVKPELDSPFNTYEDTHHSGFEEVAFGDAEQGIQKSPFEMEEEVPTGNLNKTEGPTLVDPSVDGKPNNIVNGFANISNTINEGISSIKDAAQNVAQGVLNKIDGNGVNSTQNEGPTLIDPSIDAITGNENVGVKPELDSPFNTFEDVKHPGFEEVTFGDTAGDIQQDTVGNLSETEGPTLINPSIDTTTETEVEELVISDNNSSNQDIISPDSSDIVNSSVDQSTVIDNTIIEPTMNQDDLTKVVGDVQTIIQNNLPMGIEVDLVTEVDGYDGKVVCYEFSNGAKLTVDLTNYSETDIINVLNENVIDSSVNSKGYSETAYSDVNSIVENNVPAGIEITDDAIIEGTTNMEFKFSNGTTLTVDLTNYTSQDIINQLKNMFSVEATINANLPSGFEVYDSYIVDDRYRIVKFTNGSVLSIDLTTDTTQDIINKLRYKEAQHMTFTLYQTLNEITTENYPKYLQVLEDTKNFLDNYSKDLLNDSQTKKVIYELADKYGWVQFYIMQQELLISSEYNGIEFNLCGQNKEELYKGLVKVKNALDSLPQELKKYIPKTIYIYDKSDPHSYESNIKIGSFDGVVLGAMFRGKMHIYRESYNYNNSSNDILPTIIHEIGHVVDQSKRGFFNKSLLSETPLWKNAVSKDLALTGKKAVTEYGGTSPSEDFAESIKLYFGNTEEFRRIFPNRAEVIEDIFRK